MARLHKQHPHRISEAITYGDREEISLRINKVVLAAEQTTPTEPPHYHKESRQFFVVISGTLLVEVGEMTHTVTPESALEVEPGEVYRVTGHEGNTTFLVIGTTNQEGDRVELSD